MPERVVDRLWQGFGEGLVEWYLHYPFLTTVTCLVLWFVFFLFLFWYLVLIPAAANLLDNGSFEEQLVFWGTGWLEDTPRAREQARVYRFVRSGTDDVKADAHWRADAAEHRSGGHFALRIEHSSRKRDHLYSTLAQRIRVKERTTYELSLWAKVDRMVGDGDLWVSPNGSSVFWDQPKIPILTAGNEWKRYTLTFNSGDRVDLDIRFVAEDEMVVWVDDVVVRRVPYGESLMGSVGKWLGRLRAVVTTRLRPA